MICSITSSGFEMPPDQNEFQMASIWLRMGPVSMRSGVRWEGRRTFEHARSHRYGDRTRALVLAAAAQPFARRRYAIGGSPINFADGLNGKLLIIHGTGDDNVHFQGTQRLLNKLISLNKQFHFMEYPNRRHGVLGSDPAHLDTLRYSFFEEYLPPGPR